MPFQTFFFLGTFYISTNRIPHQKGLIVVKICGPQSSIHLEGVGIDLSHSFATKLFLWGGFD